MNCQNTINREFHSEYLEMIRIMKENIDPQINRQIQLLTQQPDYNYVNYFKYDIDFAAQFVISRIERAYEQINYDHFFNQVTECQICERQNRTTSKSCLKDSDFKKRFVKSSMETFFEYPLEISQRKSEAIDEFKKKKNNLSVLTGLYNEFLSMFNHTRYIELDMQNMIKDRFANCCAPKVVTNKKDLKKDL